MQRLHISTGKASPVGKFLRCDAGSVGKLIHGEREHDFEDRLLAHLQVAIAWKLQRRECFFLSWVKTHEQGGARVSIWLGPQLSVAFHFARCEEHAINAAWVRALQALSHTPRGLIAIGEEEAQTYARKHPHLV